MPVAAAVAGTAVPALNTRNRDHRGRLAQLPKRRREEEPTRPVNAQQRRMDILMFALDERLRLAGLDPVFAADAAEEEEPPTAPEAPAGKPGRNDPCPCGSGKKYKKCHGA